MVDADVGLICRESLVVSWVEEEEVLLHLLVERRSRFVVQVAHQDERLCPLAGFFQDYWDACHSVLVGQAKVRASHNIVPELSHQEHSWLFSAWQRDAMNTYRLLLAEDTDAVLASLEVDSRGKSAEHLCLAAYLLKRIEASIALCHAVNLLNGSNIGMCFTQDLSLSRVVNLTVETCSMLYIIRCKAQSPHLFGLQRGR